LPKLQALSIPVLIIYGKHDFISGEIAAHIAHAIANAQLVTFGNCGHFAYLECASEVHQAFDLASEAHP